ncbi:MAG: prepilin-type N-terminal cleavage/methylation domain-containing protein [Pseudomonadales bacterium]|nr:prepilin-type N-terminal cleavage/methylation domain-containing protein [Pseudomonadales bacterium]
MNRDDCADSGHRPRQRGFTMLELLVAITIVGLLMAVAVPASVTFYESMQYRQAVRDVITALASARYQAVNSGRAQDVAIDPVANTIELNGKRTRLPGGLSLAVHSTRELNRDRLGVIRFYPEGGSSGGDIDLERDNGTGVTISVDWLVGRVSQEVYVVN